MHHVTLNEIANMAISADKHAFFVQLGSRIAKLRKKHRDHEGKDPREIK